jgi:hypothetical protein
VSCLSGHSHRSTHNINISFFSKFSKFSKNMRKSNSPVNKRFGMSQQNSSKQVSQGIEGNRKNERKGTPDTNPSHEVPNSFPGSSGSKPIGKKPKSDDDAVQADVKNQQESSETRESEQGSFEYNPKPIKKKKKKESKRAS